MVRGWFLILAIAPVAVRVAPARGQHADPVVARGVDYLRAHAEGAAGEAALAALALIKAEVPAQDPALAALLATVQRRFEASTYVPEKGSGADIYEAAVILLALSNHDASRHRAEIDATARFLMSRQNGNGSWDYRERTAGDTSISQYAVLGLWEAENSGVTVNPAIWDRAAAWFLSTQAPAGSWTYHRDSGGSETVAMTAAGVGSLLICARQLAPYRVAEKAANPLLIPLAGEAERRRYAAEVPLARLNAAIRAGLGWIAGNFNASQPSVIGPSPYYALYGIERLGALADLATLGKVDWFAEGRRFIQATQQADGSCSASYGTGPNTAWSVLFLTRSTAKTIRKIQNRRLGSGTLIGGRGLPRDLSQVAVAGGKVVARPMDGAVEGMLAALEDPRVEDASSALAGLIARYASEGARALKPHEARLRRLLLDPDQGVRRVAVWGLARTGDLGVVPALIKALDDPDPTVVREARLGLQLLSRRIDGFGPPDDAPPAARAEAARQWQAWYDSVRPTAAPEVANPGPGGAGSRPSGGDSAPGRAP